MIKYLTGTCLLILVLASCKKENANFTTDAVFDYFPLQVGKYITYNLDSTVFLNFGKDRVEIHYQAQDRVEAQITDNLGRQGFTITRYLRKDSTQEWTPSIVMMAIPTKNSVELVENNLRFIKLMSPIKQDFSWKGNSYIDTYSNDLGVTYLDDWDYVYDSVGASLTINSLNIDSTVSVDERDEFLGQDPSLPGTQYAEKTYSIEKYGKGIGLIYREFLHWEFQGGQTGTPDYYVGYGIKLSITGHN
jgi:hypothetical protein